LICNIPLNFCVAGALGSFIWNVSCNPNFFSTSGATQGWGDDYYLVAQINSGYDSDLYVMFIDLYC
jgi:hypothetical protein